MWLSRISDHDADGLVSYYKIAMCVHCHKAVKHPDMTLDDARKGNPTNQQPTKHSEWPVEFGISVLRRTCICEIQAGRECRLMCAWPEPWQITTVDDQYLCCCPRVSTAGPKRLSLYASDNRFLCACSIRPQGPFPVNLIDLQLPSKTRAPRLRQNGNALSK